jgi:hypothetical protein
MERLASITASATSFYPTSSSPSGPWARAAGSPRRPPSLPPWPQDLSWAHAEPLPVAELLFTVVVPVCETARPRGRLDRSAAMAATHLSRPP